MEFRSFCGENQSLQELTNEQYHQPQAGVCWCKGAYTSGEMIQNLMAEIKLTIREEVEKGYRNLIVANLSSLQSSVLHSTSRASCLLPHQTEPPALRRFQLQFKSNIPDDTLYTMIKLEDHQCTLFEVVLLDEFGNRVEQDLESPVKIKIHVLNGDFDVEENANWTQKDFDENIVKNRKYKGGCLLMGDCKIALSKGVASLGHLSFADNSSYMTNKTFRLGATAEGSFSGVVINAAVSQEFRVKERRTKGQGKLKEPYAEDALYCLTGIAKTGPVYDRARNAGIVTVKDFLIQLEKDQKELKKVLNVGEANWNKIVKHARACKLPEVANERQQYDISPEEQEQLQLVPHPLGFCHSSQEGECLISSQLRDMPHTNIDRDLLFTSPTQVYSGPTYGSFTQENVELPETSILDDIEQWLQQFMRDNSSPQGERGSVYENSSHDNATSKLIAACYVTRAATLFMISVQQDSRKKQKLM